MPRSGAVPPWMSSTHAGFPEGEFGISPPWLLGRNRPGLSKFPHPTLGNVLISADQQMFSKKCFAVGFSGCRGFLSLLFPLLHCGMRDVAHAQGILHGLQESNKQPRLRRKWMETQPRKMRSEGFSLGLTLCPETLRAVLSLTAAGLGPSWGLCRNLVLEQCRVYSSPFPFFFPINPVFFQVIFTHMSHNSYFK